MNKILKWIGAFSALTTPTIAIVACSKEEKKQDQITQQEITLGYNLVTLGKFIETNGAFVKDTNDPKWPVAIKRVKSDDEIEPRYNLIKILDAGLTQKSLSDTWPSELKWWATSFAYALSQGLYNQNKIGADIDWDGAKGQALGQVAKGVIDNIFTNDKEKASFKKWADAFIAHRKEVKEGASAYSETEKKLVGQFVNDFKEKAIKLAVGLIKVWAKRWNWNWTTYDAAKLLRFVSYRATKAIVQKWVNKNGTEVRIPKETNIPNFTDQKALNSSDRDHTFVAGWYNQGLATNKDQSKSSQPVSGLTISRVTKDLQASALDTFTIQGGAFSGAAGVNTNNWKKVSSGAVAMIYLGKDEPNAGKIFVRKDAITSDNTLTGNLAAKVETVKNKPNYDKYGKTVVWYDRAKKVTKFWTIADFKMYFNFPRVVAQRWTTSVGTERRYKSSADFDQLIEYATNKIKLLI